MSASPRDLLAVSFLLIGFLLLCVFYGMSVNAIVFTTAIFALLGATSVLGAARIVDAVSSQPFPFSVVAFFLVTLIANYQWSISRDSSFASIWALAIVPTVFIAGRVLGVWRWRLHAVIGAVVLCFAALSLMLYFRSGDVSAAPLVDSNNYATLLYMIFIPWSYVYLLRCWRHQASGSERAVWLAALSVLSLALFSLESRGGVIIIAAALCAYIGLMVYRHLRMRPVVDLVLVTIVAYVLITLISPFANDFTSESLGEGAEVRAYLNSAALSIAREYPIFGSGILTFPLLYRLIRDPLEQTTAGLSVHNDYLQLLAEGGPFLVLPMLILLGGTTWCLLRLFFRRPEEHDLKEFPDASFGILLALGAVLAHAAINFVFFTPALAFLVGLSASMVEWQNRDVPVFSKARYWIWTTRGLLAGAWICFSFLLLDTYSLGVLGGQKGIPFTDSVRKDVGRMLSYARFAESVNANRGVPVLAQAMIYDRQLREAPENEYLRDLALHTYRRAVRIDPWNPDLYLRMYEFVAQRPDLSAELEESEQPENLLLKSVVLDPGFVPGFDTIIAHYESIGQPEVAYRILEKRFLPWVQWLAERDADAVRRLLKFMSQQAVVLGDETMRQELTELVKLADRPTPRDATIWWTSTGQ